VGDIPMHIYEFGPFRVDSLRRTLLREGKQVRLPSKAFEILLVLLEGKGRLVEKDELMQRVWPDTVVEENNLTVNISALRRSLTESPGEHRYVVTVPGRGYQFVAEVRQPGVDGSRESEQELTNQVATKSALTQSNSSASQTDSLKREQHIDGELNRRKQGVLLILAPVLAIAIMVSYLAYSRHLAASRKPGTTSIAVLPFANETGDANAEYLSEGISESLTNSLSQLPGVKVAARSSAFQYKGTDSDLQDVARALGVGAILTGKVTQRGENLAISVELVDASDKTQIWGAQYDRKMSDLLEIQREIAREIVARLRLKISSEANESAKHYTESNEAYQLYLKGRYYWNKRTAEALKKSIEYFNQAIDKDPRFALAYAGLADSYVVPANRLSPRDAMPKAKAAAIRALELDETLAEAHVSLGRVLAAYDWDWTNAEKEYKRAIELNPRYATAHQWYGGYLSVMGRSDEAIAERKLALELEPLSLVINFELGLSYYHARNYDKAIEQFQKTLELDQNFPAAHNFLPAAHEQKGMYKEAIAEFKQSIPLAKGSDSTLSKAGLGHVYAVTGRKSDAEILLGELKETFGREYLPASNIALIYAGLDENDQAFTWLNKAYEQRAFQLQWINLDPRWDNLRSDPRFQEMLSRIGLPH
jgi:DNA-binding winged helix-turn-helix (wHTH) protein/TolB-like protein/Flp pilus assembly protein TadD